VFFMLLKIVRPAGRGKKASDFASSLCGVTFLEHCIIACVSFKSCRVSQEYLLMDCAFQ